MTMHHTRSGRGKPLLLVHGLGGSYRSWDTISATLAKTKEVIALDLPGHGQTPAEADSGTFKGLARSLDDWLVSENLAGIDMVGSSMGARLVLEMARRGRAGAVVALDPGGFWQGWERTFFRTTITASIALVRAMHRLLPAITRNVAGRTALMLQLSAKPWALQPALVLKVVCRYTHLRRTRERSRHRPNAGGPCSHLGAGYHRLGPQGSAVSASTGTPCANCLPRRHNALVRAKRALPDVGSATGDYFGNS